MSASVVPDVPPRVLVVRGASGTGGFLEGGSDDQLSDIDDSSTEPGNHGWYTWAELLRSEGFEVDQVVEGDGSVPVNLDPRTLADYDVLVLGSNNADYPVVAVDSVEQWVRTGGGLLVISDANWGSSWADAPSSDEPFLERFDLEVNQDHGRYALTTSDYVAPEHPILEGVRAFDGEGVSPFTVRDSVPDVDPVILARARGDVRRPTGDPGALSPATADDAALVVVMADRGRVTGHFDRNTFFNPDGAGTDITRLDNARLAVNVVRWLASP